MLILMAGCKQESVKTPESVLPIPTQKQLDWQKEEMLMFVHFGIKTFYPSDNHMGDGLEDPNRFDPVDFDAKQWVKAALAGGFKGIVLTSKHHDGFCNWQTETTEHSLKNSAWRDGKGDVVKELADACHEAGIMFGLYSSIYDQSYEKSGKDKAEYSDFYIAQLTELLSNYGKVDELWFDGFGAENMKVDFKKVSEVIVKYQPEAIIYDSGTLVSHLPDDCVSWPGAHGGVSDPSWSFIDEKASWYPPEASLIIQGNWFYHGEPMISQKKLQDYYLNTVGLNAVALMNVAPNQNGLIDEETIEGLQTFKKWVDALNQNDLTKQEGVKISADSYRGNSRQFAAEKAIDGNYDTYYATDDQFKTAIIEIDLGEPEEIEGLVLQEYIPLGQRVSEYSIECKIDGQWKKIATQHTIGYKRIILGETKETNGKPFPKSRFLRVVISDARACPLINNIQVIPRLD